MRGIAYGIKLDFVENLGRPEINKRREELGVRDKKAFYRLEIGNRIIEIDHAGFVVEQYFKTG